jgi:uncharacterized protein
MPEISKEETLKLINLQKCDTKIDLANSQLAKFPQEIEKFNEEIETIRENMENEKKSLQSAKVRQKELENELATKESEIEKHQVELNAVKSNDAFKALLSEIETLKSQVDDMETKILSGIDDINAEQVKEKELLEKTKVLENEIQQKISKVKEEEASLKNNLTELQADRERLVKEVSPEFIAKYEYLRKQRQGLAICQTSEKQHGELTCSGCNMKLMPNISVELKKSNSFVTCDNCQRILYGSDLVKEISGK